MKQLLMFKISLITRVLVVCFFLQAIQGSCYSQPEKMLFERFSTNDGMSNGYVNSILRESRGFIWIATGNGLNRFDGINFKKYFYDPADTSSLPGNAITSLAEDSHGNLWVMTLRGLCLYNKKLDCFSRKILRTGSESLTNQFIFGGTMDSRGFLWVCATNGIFRFNTLNVSSHFIEADYFTLNEDDVDRVYKNKVYNFAEDHEGNIWAVSCSNKLFMFDAGKNKFIDQSIDIREASELSNHNKNFAIDRDGDFFITVERIGLVVWRRKAGQFRLYRPDGTDSMPEGNVLSSVVTDKDGLIWIGDRDEAGISVFDKETEKFTYIKSSPDNPYSLNTGKINYIYHDGTGSVWVCTILGVNKYSPGRFIFKRSFGKNFSSEKLNSGNVLCLAEGKEGEIWIGTDGGGLNRYNRKTGKIDSWTHNPDDLSSLSSNAIISICEDHEGVLWLGTYNGGLARFKNNRFSAFMPDNSNPFSISAQHIWYVLEDSRNNLWVATLTNGLDLYDRKTNRFYNFNHKDDDPTSICDNSLVQLFEDSQQNLYITSNQGISVVDLKTINLDKGAPEIKFRNLSHSETSNSISGDDVSCVAEDKNGNLWIGMNGTGLDKLDRNSGLFSNYSIKDGLPGNSITSILVDENNNLWLATNNGLARFTPETKKVRVFTRDEGLLNLAMKGWALKTLDNEMFFSGPDGINSFYPSEIRDDKNPNKPNVVITNFRIFNKPVKVHDKIDNRIILESDIAETKSLTLTYKENFFTFEFISLELTSPGENLYAYKMEGFDPDWIFCGTKREANYTNLSPGSYTFRVKASNNSGLLNEEGVSLSLTILPPWWKTIWFRLIAITTTVLAFVFIITSRFRRLKVQRQILEKMVDQKTSELRSMNQDLKDVVATKDKFFSIIAHDIKNPFNVIIGSSDILESEFDEISREEMLELIHMISKSSNNLNNLLDNLLKWSYSQRGSIVYNPEPAMVRDFLLGIIEMMNNAASAKDITLSFSITEAELTVLADRQMIDTVVRNLIGNAIKFTSRGGSVIVSAERDGKFAKICVTDNGMGISMEALDKLFNINSSITTIGTENEKGSGLGLVLAREFVSKHGGTIRADSIVGKGSSFCFTLPLENEQ